MYLYNSLSRKKEEFVPGTPGKVSLYTCGITAYDYCHIGHARSSIVFDVLVRYLRHLGYEVTFVRNFTDVDDKIITRAKADNLLCEAVASRFIAAFHEDMDRLGVHRADVEPKATDYIPDMIALCATLVDKGFAYAVSSGDVYFRVRAFSGYGRLSGRNIDEMRAGARILPGEEKEDPLDFALWKSAKPGEPFWDSPWGPGRPGWHIECSVMSERELTLPLDIHGGGQDLVFPHHENEIAQTEAATGKTLARFWLHNGFVQVNSQKMSKSLGNFKTIRDLLKRYLPEVVRFFLLGRHYHSPIDFTEEALEDSEKNLKRMYETLLLLQQEGTRPAPRDGSSHAGLRDEYERLACGWNNAMNDDLNTAAAIGHCNGLMHMANKILDDKALLRNAGCREILEKIRSLIAVWNGVLGILGNDPQKFLDDLKVCRAGRHSINLTEVDGLMQKRQAARAARDFAAADALRRRLTLLGIEVRDTPEGAVWDIA
ncbi:MAG: cysteine--tRNA ligase [Desulfovibrio sp.]|jgi:cysteinyl-tRNA synthetase|nr:cysteine--tRNA ligase [Desulfovibrio sp.]